MKITVLYFAAVRDLVETDEESIEIPVHVRTIAELSRHLASRHSSLDGRLASVRFARNEVFATSDETISDGDVIALIPPVAGG